MVNLNGIQNLTNLQILQCSYNNITTLNDIDNLVILQDLFCHHNKLTTLNGIQYLTKKYYVVLLIN